MLKLQRAGTICCMRRTSKGGLVKGLGNAADSVNSWRDLFYPTQVVSFLTIGTCKAFWTLTRPSYWPQKSPPEFVPVALSCRVFDTEYKKKPSLQPCIPIRSGSEQSSESEFRTAVPSRLGTKFLRFRGLQGSGKETGCRGGGRSCRREQLPHRSSSQFIIDTLALAAGEEFVLLICTSEFWMLKQTCRQPAGAVASLPESLLSVGDFFLKEITLLFLKANKGSGHHMGDTHYRKQNT